MLKRGMGYAMAAALAGCATPQPPAPAEVRPAETTAPQTIESQPLKYLAKRKLAPMPDRAINIKTSCKFRDQTGYRGHLDLQVRDDEVRRFSAEVDIPKRGSCHFDLKNFRQASGRPVALQTASDDACVVRVWEQQNRVTVAFRDCQAQCSGDSFDYLWPILVDAPTGKCS